MTPTPPERLARGPASASSTRNRPGRGGPEWAAYPLGVAWALWRRGAGRPDDGADIAIASDVPVGAGLSSSAAIEGAVASALNDEWSAGLSPVELARVGRTAENDAVGAPDRDHGPDGVDARGADAATFLDCRTLETDAVELGFGPAGLTLLVMDTNVEHSHATGGYRERRESCEAGAAARRRVAARCHGRRPAARRAGAWTTTPSAACGTS